MTPGGGIEPPQRQPAPGKFSLPTPPQTDRETRSRDETPKKSCLRDSTTPGGGIEPPRRQPAPGTPNTNPDQTPDPTDRPTDRPTDPHRANLPRRLAPQRPARAGRRIPIRALRRLRRRPRRQPAVSAAARSLPSAAVDRGSRPSAAAAGQVAALAEQNPIDLVPAVVASSHTCKKMIRGIAAEGQREAL